MNFVWLILSSVILKNSLVDSVGTHARGHIDTKQIDAEDLDDLKEYINSTVTEAVFQLTEVFLQSQVATLQSLEQILLGNVSVLISAYIESTLNDVVSQSQLSMQQYLQGQVESLNENMLELYCYIQGFVYFDGSCYTVKTVEKNQQDAREDCQLIGADLVVINNEEEFNFVVGLHDGDFWIGLDDLEVEGEYRWLDGQIFNLEYNHWWDTDQPNNWRDEQDCNHVVPDNKINDVSCSYEFAFICEKKANSDLQN